MRRSDREVKDKSEIIKIIEKCDVCRLGLCNDNIPYIIPLNFGFEYINEELILYFHGAGEGKKIDMVKNNPIACFEMDCSRKLIESELAWKYTMEYESVIGTGKISFCLGKDEKIKALSVIMKTYAKDKEFDFPVTVLDSVTTFKLIVNNFSGKRLKRT